MTTRFEHSAGGVVIRGTGKGTEVALASRRTRRGGLAWGLPKGLIEPEEDAPTAALREVREETGLEARIIRPLGDITYAYVWDGERVRKRVSFFLMEATGGDLSQHDSEVEEVRWFRLESARRRAGYRSEADVLARAIQALASPATG